MGTEELLIFRIENDLRKLKNNKAQIKDLQIKARLERLSLINKPMFEDLNKQLEEIINPVLYFDIAPQLSQKALEFNKLFKN